jgi:hypothetical protein
MAPMTLGRLERDMARKFLNLLAVLKNGHAASFCASMMT